MRRYVRCIAAAAATGATDLAQGWRRPIVNVDWIADAEGLASLAEEWEGLLARVPRPSIFLSFPWVHSWWDVFQQGKQLLVLTVREPNGTLAGILPAYVSRALAYRALPLRMLRFIGEGESMAADHLDFIAEPQKAADVARALAGWLSGHRRLWDVVRLTALGLESNIVRHLAPALATRSVHVEGPAAHSVCPYLTLPGSMEALFEGFSYRQRKNLRRYRRKTEQDFDMRVRRCLEPDDLPDAMDHLRRLHALRKSDQGISGKFEDARYRRFHGAVARGMLERGALELTFLVLDGHHAAALYGFKYHGVLFEYQTGFDPQFASYSVQNVLEGFILEQAIAEGVSEVDLLRGEEAYKSQWTKTAREQVSLLVENHTPRGLLHRGLRSVRDGLRRDVTQSPPFGTTAGPDT